MNELALFAGGGLGLLGSKLLGHRIVCYVERDPGCVAILRARIADGYLDDAPIWDDIQTFDGHPWAGHVDLISAGFPCQPYSQAGKKMAERDERNLWPDTLRIIGEVRPSIIFLENVSALLRYKYFGSILASLSEIGYCPRWTTLQGQNVGSPQYRKRVFIMANANGIGLQEEHSLSREPDKTQAQQYKWWLLQPVNSVRGKLRRVPEFQFLGMDYGYPTWVDRVRAIGQGQLPAVVRLAWQLLKEK